MSNPNGFFGKKGLRQQDLYQAVLAEGSIRSGLGGQLWFFQDGVYRAGGENEVRRRCRVLLGQRWRITHQEGVVSQFKAEIPTIGDDPPTRWINCRNGLIDWRTAELHEHDPAVPSTFQLPVRWNPAATCPTVDEWIAEVAPDDATNLIWQVIGAAIYADFPVHKAILIYGPGRNGKGTLLRLIKALVGPENCAAVTLQALGENRFAAAESTAEPSMLPVTSMRAP